jgi:L-seryl-tRNA(Ser) seleniumtransferase
MTHSSDPRRQLPAVSSLLERPAVQYLLERFPRPHVLEAIRACLEQCRMAPEDPAPTPESIDQRIEEVLMMMERDRLRPVVNGTGVVLHTGLGRAVLPPAAAAALARMDRCCNLQMDLETGLRGKRNASSEEILCEITGAEAALLVNNNAAATLLVLAALCSEREVVVSRGQLIEIGGSYRLPDCIHQSGARMMEVGTTNKTHLRDYEAAVRDQTAAFLRVNPSNYRIVGFSNQVSTRDLTVLRDSLKPQNILVIDDLGCGALVDLQDYGLPEEPTVQDSIAAGADICCFSGDKLIGGPQSGIIIGRKELVQKIRKHPLTRMLRVGKLTDAALEATLRLFLEPTRLLDRHPTLCMLAKDADGIRGRAEALLATIRQRCPELTTEIRSDWSAVGGGSLPDTPLPTFCVCLQHPRLDCEEFARALRISEPPVIPRISEGEVRIDVRTLLDGDDVIIVEVLTRLSSM